MKRSLATATLAGALALAPAHAAHAAPEPAATAPIVEPCALGDWSPFCRPLTPLEQLAKLLQSGSSGLSANRTALVDAGSDGAEHDRAIGRH